MKSFNSQKTPCMKKEMFAFSFAFYVLGMIYTQVLDLHQVNCVAIIILSFSLSLLCAMAFLQSVIESDRERGMEINISFQKKRKRKKKKSPDPAGIVLAMVVGAVIYHLFKSK